MSIKIMNEVWTKSKMDGTALLLLLALADNANDDGHCWPSTHYLAEKIRVSKRSVIRLVKKIEAAGELKVKREKGHSNRYQIVVTECHQCQNVTGDTHDTTVVTNWHHSGDTHDTTVVTPVSPRTVKNHQRTVREPSSKKKTPQPVEIPATLQTNEFIQAWQDFTDHRKEIKAKMTPRAATMQLNKLAEQPPEIATAMIKQSIMNGWKGIFELKQRVNGNGRNGDSRMQKGINAIDQAFEEMEAQGLV